MSGLVDWAAWCRRLASEVGLGWFRPRGSDNSGASVDAHIGVLPLWSIRDHDIGLLAVPGRPNGSWPGVITRGEDCWTLAADRSTLVPQLLVRSLRRTEEGIALAREWSDVARTLSALHAHLGGDDDTLEAVANSVGSIAASPEVDRSRLIGSLFRVVDPSSASRSYADWVDAASAGAALPPAVAESYGPWSRRVVCWSEVLDLAGHGSGRFAAPSRHAVIEAAAGVDSGVPPRVSWRADIGEGSAETVLLEAAMRTQQESDVEDVVTRALALAMDTEGTEYRGLAHAEAVVVLKDRGEPERAWGALLSAAWWSSRRMGELPDFVLNGGRLLAEENGWTDVSAVLERRDGIG